MCFNIHMNYHCRTHNKAFKHKNATEQEMKPNYYMCKTYIWHIKNKNKNIILNYKIQDLIVVTYSSLRNLLL